MIIGLEGANAWKQQLLLSLIVGSIAVLSGCTSGSGQSPPTGAATTSVAPTSTSPNQAPTISGSPGSNVAVGQQYTFVPVAADADGDTIGFVIENRPTWATFDTASGRLTGTPTQSNIGTFANIRISVSDGKATTALPGFALSVSAAGASSGGVATLSWAPPTQNVDGSALTNLGGYRIKYGTKENELTQEITINGSASTTYTVTALSPATYFFAIQAVSTEGAESALSAVASKTIT